MRKLFKYLKFQDYIFIGLSLLLVIFQVWLDLKLPEFMSEITTHLQMGSEINQILINGGYMLVCALSSFALSFVVGFFAAKIAAGLGMRMRSALYSRVNTFSKQEIHKFSTASLITRCTNDTNQVQRIVAMGLQIFMKAPILVIWGILKILNKSWQWTIVTAIAVAFLMLVIVIIVGLCLPKFKIVQKQTDDLNRVTRENLTGMRIIHAFNAEEYQNKKFEVVNNNLTKTQTFTSKALSFFSPIMAFLVGGLSLAIYWVGAFVINNAAMADKINLFSDMIVFSTYAMLIIMSFIMMIVIFMQLPRAVVSARRINEVLDTNPIIKDGAGVTPTKRGIIEFKNVSFKYPDAKDLVLSDINLTINEGETVAFIGATGCGKTTLIDLIPRFYDATEGEVLVDGENVKDYKLSKLLSKIGYVSQKAILLSGTVYENVSMGHDIQPEDILKAIEQAQAKEFVEDMKDREHSRILQSGKNISGGQKQRLSIARAIAQKPEFIIFDDSFSALDYKTDRKLRKTLEKELNKTTCIIVAQRISTIKNSDRIVVLKDGKIAGVGKHEELLKKCKDYKDIALSQLSKEELV